MLAWSLWEKWRGRYMARYGRSGRLQVAEETGIRSSQQAMP